ncbi:Ribokinase-like protein [Gongronella butleri]|nr:Ribokinase-like protein [Gongronella butleri]
MRPLIVVGGVALDITATTHSVKGFLHTSTVGTVKHSLGGVGRNVCEAAHRAGARSILLSAVGDDMPGHSLRQGMADMHMDTALLQTSAGHASAVYNAFHTADGQLLSAVADMSIFDHLDLDKISSVFQSYKPALVCFDGNITSAAMAKLTAACRSLGIPAFFEPTSIPKSVKAFASDVDTRAIAYTSPNQYELEAMIEHCDTSSAQPLSAAQQMPRLDDLPLLARQQLEPAWCLSHTIPHVITKLGEHGCLYVSQAKKAISYIPPEPLDPSTVLSVTGAGDSFVGVLLANLARDPLQDDLTTWRGMISCGQKAAIRTLQSKLAVSPSIGSDLVLET